MPAINLSIAVRYVLLFCALLLAANFAGCVAMPTPAGTITAISPASPVAVFADSPAPPHGVSAAPVDDPAAPVQLDSRVAPDPHPRAGQYKLALRQQAHFVWGLDAPVSSFAAQIHQESRWNATARSPVGAAGLTQFMPATAAWIGTTDAELKNVNVYNPRWAMRALVVYDKFLYAKVAGVNPCERMAFAMSAYNGGLGWVNKRKARSSSPAVCFGATCDINPGITAANQRENAHYPRVILQSFEPKYVRAGWGRGVCHE